jgi:hypothetical protein
MVAQCRLPVTDLLAHPATQASAYALIYVIVEEI